MATPYELLLGMSLLHEKKRIKSSENETSEGSSFLVIDIAGYEIFIRQNDIEEVIPVTQITQVPDTKAWLKGLTSFRGDLLPLIDLSILLGQKNDNNCQQGEVRVLVIEGAEGLLGLIVSKVEGIHHHWLNKETTDTLDDKDAAISRYCQFYSRQNNKRVAVLDINKIRKSRELLRNL